MNVTFRYFTLQYNFIFKIIFYFEIDCLEAVMFLTSNMSLGKHWIDNSVSTYWSDFIVCFQNLIIIEDEFFLIKDKFQFDFT